VSTDTRQATSATRRVRDPRGKVRTITAVELTRGATLVTCDCGHVGKFAPHFTYKIGASIHCYSCPDFYP